MLSVSNFWQRCPHLTCFRRWNIAFSYERKKNNSSSCSSQGQILQAPADLGYRRDEVTLQPLTLQLLHFHPPHLRTTGLPSLHGSFTRWLFCQQCQVWCCFWCPQLVSAMPTDQLAGDTGGFQTLLAQEQFHTPLPTSSALCLQCHGRDMLLT